MTDIIAETDKLLKELKQENEQLQHDATILILSNQDYRRENEQLKQQINGLNEEKDQLIQCYNNNLNEMDAITDDNIQLQKENKQLQETIEFIFKQIKAFREDCRTNQYFDGASTITQLIKILGMKE